MTAPPAYTIGKSTRHRRNHLDTNPGPGQYTTKVNSSKTKTPSWKFGSTKRTMFGVSEQIPGPGQYDQSSNIRLKSSFPKTIAIKYNDQSIQNNNDQPGPDYYRPQTSNLSKQNPRFTFQKKYYMNQTQTQPGPANYTVNKYNSINNRPSSKIGRMSKFGNNYTENQEGPAQFNLQSHTIQTQKGVSFTRQRQLVRKNDVPGVGSYNVRENVDKRFGKSMGQKFTNKHERFNNVGPGSYEPKKPSYEPNCKIGNEYREYQKKNKNINPGPNVYSPQMMNRPSTANYSVGRAQRTEQKQNTNPGPGSYLKTEYVSNGPRYPIAQKYYTQTDNSQPGPMDYQPSVNQTKNTHPLVTIGKGQRQLTQENNPTHPGVGQYELNNNDQGIQITIPHEKKLTNNSLDYPGPGTYNVTAKFADTNKYLLDPSNTRSSKFLTRQSAKHTTNE